MPASAEEQQAQVEAKEAAEEQRRVMLAALLQPSARDRRECWLAGGALACNHWAAAEPWMHATTLAAARLGGKRPWLAEGHALTLRAPLTAALPRC